MRKTTCEPFCFCLERLDFRASLERIPPGEDHVQQQPDRPHVHLDAIPRGIAVAAFDPFSVEGG